MDLSPNKKAAVAFAAPIAAVVLAAAGCGTSAPTVSPPAHGTGTAPPTTPASPAPSPTQAQVGDKFTIEPNGSTKYDITLLSVEQNARPESEFDAAPSGHHLAAAQFRVQAITKVDENANNSTTVTGSNDQAYTPSLVSVAEGTNFADGQVRLQPGGSLVGWVTFTVPAGVHVSKVEWTPVYGFSRHSAEWVVSGKTAPAPTPTGATPTSPASSPSPASPAPTPTAAPGPAFDPADTVRAYFAAINSGNYAEAWRLGGRHVEPSYSRFVSGFKTTASVAVEILSVSGNVVTARLDTVETDGTGKSFQGEYTVNNGVITAFHVHEIS